MFERSSTPVNLRAQRQLTASQELIWTSQRLHADAPLANMANCSRIVGPIDSERFVDALSTVVAGSDALRMTVREVDGVPQPTVHQSPPRATEVIPLDESALADWMAKRISTPIDIGVCVYDSVLIDHGDHVWSWWMNIHHIATDAASSAQIFRSVAAAYFGDWQPSMSYAELADELLAAEDSPRWRKAMSHWADSSADSSRTELYKPDSGPTTHAERVHVEMGPARQTQMRELLDGRFKLLSPDLSLTAALATAITAYLHRLNGSTSVSIGIPIHHRATRSAKAVIGPMVELFPLTIDVAPADTFSLLHERAAKALLALLGSAQPGTSPRQEFDVVLNVHAATFGHFGDYPATHKWIHPGHIDSHHRLRVQALDYDGSGDLELALDINHRSADSDHRQRAPKHVGKVLDAMFTDPDRPLRAIALVTNAERSLFELFTKPGPGIPLVGAAPDLVEAQLAERGEQVVLREAGTALTAGEVNSKITEVANKLTEAGVGRGDLVAIEMPLGIDAVLAIHGVLRAGAAFVPIDPSYPASRREYIASDSGAAMIVRSCTDITSMEPLDSARARTPIESTDLAYVIYTSGSTGQPKGVPITHAGLSEYLGFACDAYVDGNSLVMPLYTSLSFDLTITTLLLPWLAGGEMTVHPAGGLPALREIVDEGRATLIKATPSHLELLVRMVGADHSLRTLIVGGEAFMVHLADQLIEVLGEDVAIYNEYGPTEAVVGCMIHRYDPMVDLGPEVPIGRPAPGVELHILDAIGHPVPLGVEGELFVGRRGMTDGYLNRPDLNKSRFLRNHSSPETMLYRTGDRVRMIDADRMVYLGRLDTQIKVGGIRTEIGEIEAAARTVPGVRRAVAALWTPTRDPVPVHCVRCGLGGDVPDVAIDHDGVCSVCHDFDVIAPQAAAWFKTEDELRSDLAAARRRSTGHFDVLHLLSGGKDSTYALYRLHEMGARVFSLTLDNGFISEGAKENVRRATAALGVAHEFVTVDGMNEIFRDSLERFSNVCNGCYKTIYTLALERADQLGIPAIVTGLSRGQFFETRLVPELFAADRFDPNRIDEAVAQARRAYHATPDAVSENLDVDFLADGRVLDEIEFIDFYRYVDVELAELYRTLEESGTWLRPTDTGRSTNCLINAAGIQVHKMEKGHHNYAVPYSWDVRLGHKTRAEAREELDDPMDAGELRSITTMLADVGFTPRPPEVLTLWVELDGGLEESFDVASLRAALAELLPAHALPTAVEIVDDFPLTPNGKVDTAALPAPSSRQSKEDSVVQRPPTSSTEVHVAGAWSRVLGVDDLSTDDDFFALGGTSLHALEMIVRLSDVVGFPIAEKLPFRHRTIAELAEAIDLLDRDGAATDECAVKLPVLAPHDKPLSVGEEALLFEWRRDPTDRRLNVARLYHLPDGVDRERFDAACRAVVTHQPTLHTSYGTDRRVFTIDETLSIGSEADERDSIACLAARLNEEPFDLISGPLMTVHHLSSDMDSGQAVLIRTHHISSDAGSLDVLWDQIDRAYRGEDLPALDVSYAAHGQWQRDNAPSPEVAWPVEPGASIGRLELRPSGQEPDGYVHRACELTNHDLQAGPGTTAFATALTALAAAIEPYHDLPTFEIAVTASVRDHPGLSDVVGYFLNPLPLLVNIDRASTFTKTAAHVDDVLVAGLEYRTIPFVAIARNALERGVPAPGSRVMLAVENLARAELDGQEIAHTILPSGTAVNDLTFFVQIRGEGIELGCEYRGALVDRSQADALLDRFEQALTTACSDPMAVIDSITSTPEPLAGPALSSELPLVPDRITAAVADGRLRIVARSGSASITYADLEDQSLALAARLRAVGVEAGDRVAVVLPRSVELPVAIQAIWALGASYVPIDVAQPASRVASLVAAAGVAVAVTSGEGHAGLSDLKSVRADATDDAVLPIGRRHETSGEDEAYLIFTSGSTGKPKGVPITHANLAASVAARLDFYSKPAERYLLMSSAGFDSSVAGLFWVLSQGGELIIPTEDEVHNIDALLALIAAHKPTHTLCVPSLYSALLDRNKGAITGLDTVIVAGEVCPVELAQRHHRLGGGSLVNEYGPTEATVWATAHECNASDPWTTAPIGSPISGVTVDVSDRFGRPVPIDVAGELAISGVTVTAGYLGDDSDDESKAEFSVDESGVRWYRTGDLVVRRPGGVLEFLGRIDEQMSIGGVRIEPTEIELTLTSFAGVHNALVAERDAQLIAWVECDDHIAGPSLVAALRKVLSPTHVPRAVVPVERLPRNSNGKIDRLRVGELPDIGETSASAEAADNDAGSAGLGDNPLLTSVVAAFVDAFDGRAVGPDDGFFELGGDSLRAVALVSLLEERFGSRIGIGELIDAPTPRSLASRIDVVGHLADAPKLVLAGNSATGPDRAGLVEWLRRTGDRAPLVVLPPGGGNLLRYAPLVGALDVNVPVVGIRLPGADARSEIIETVEGQAEVMLAALDTAVDSGPYRLLGWSTGGLLAWEIARLLRERGDEVELVALVDTVMGGLHAEPVRSPLEKYVDMLQHDGVRPVAQEAFGRIRERMEFSLARRRYRNSRDDGAVPDMADAERQLGPVVRRASLAYRPPALDLPTVYFSASDSGTELTLDPWTELLGEQDMFRVVPVDGSHHLPEERCIIGPDRVHLLVAELDL